MQKQNQDIAYGTASAAKIRRMAMTNQAGKWGKARGREEWNTDSGKGGTYENNKNTLNIRNIRNTQQVFCDWRRQWVCLTPEEWVRQHFLHRLVEEYRYPHALIGVEVAIRVGEAKKRCDAIVYTPQMQPIVLIECKAEHVPLTQKTLDQAITYNRRLDVPYLFLHNGTQTVVSHIHNQQHDFLNHIPAWNQLYPSTTP